MYLLKLGVLSRVATRSRVVALVGALTIAAVVAVALIVTLGPFWSGRQPVPPADPLWRASEELERVYIELGDTTVRDLVDGALTAMADATEAEGETRADSDTERRERLSDLIRKVTDVVPDDVPREFEDVWRAWRALTEAGADPEKLLVDTLRGMVRATGDPGAQVLVGVSATDDDFAADDYEGIGSLVDPLADQLVITVPIPGGPAARAGLRSGDVVVAVDGDSVEGLGAQEVIARVRGPAGTEVNLTVERPDVGRLDVAVVREEVAFSTVASRPLHGVIAYLSIARFDEGTPDELARELEFLRQEGIGGLVLDLRANPGGSRRAGSAVADQFLDGGVVYLEETLDGTRITHEAEPGGPGIDLSLAVLVDGRTLGVAEIVAAALQQNRRGTLLGQRTGGNALLYSSREVGEELVVVLPSSRWFTPEGSIVFGNGLQPDGIVNVGRNDLLIGIDSQIQAAFGFLWTQLYEDEAQEAAEAPAVG